MHRTIPVALIAVLAALAAPVDAAQANTFVVTKRGDPAPGGCEARDCSLREAVFAANIAPGRDVIALPNRRKPYNLRQAGTNEDGALDGDLDVSNNPLVIKHPGKGRATVDGNGIERVLEVFAGARTTLRKLVITGGANQVSGGGGGIRSDANLSVIRSRIAGNKSSGHEGGGIDVDSGARLKLVRSVVAGNVADPDNGGGIDGSNGAIEIIRSKIAHNVATDEEPGGGLLYGSDESSRIVDSTIVGNGAGFGGGVAVLSTADGILRIRGTTISGNSAGDGGGLGAGSSVRLTNSTLAANRAFVSGGGIHALFGAEVSLNAVTVARNVADLADVGATGGGIYRQPPSNGIVPELAIENSLIASNRLGTSQRNDCAGHPFDSLGHNLLSTRGPAGACEGFDRASDRVRSSPRIGKLKRNGGPTKTIALLRRSTALNEAKRSTAPKRDQRGKRRGRKKDIGAYERNTGR